MILSASPTFITVAMLASIPSEKSRLTRDLVTQEQSSSAQISQLRANFRTEIGH